MNDNFDLLISGGSVYLPNNKIEESDIGIKDSKILAIGNLQNKKYKTKIDAKNLLIMPGAIDSQVHFREPGLTHKEDIFCGTRGAVLGGITTIFEMPNTKPSTTNKEALDEKLKIADKHAHCNYSFFMGAAKENIEKLGELERVEGCCGVKIFMGSSTGDLLVEDDESLKKILSNINRRVAVHSEDEYRLRERINILESDHVNVSFHPKWRDVETALNSTKRLLKIAGELNKKIHVLHISTRDEIELLKSYKSFATCEATPQHLFFKSPECYETLGTLAQMNPPIRDESHQVGIWKGVTDRVIDVIGSDHAPHTIEEKKQLYPKSPSGMPGTQTIGLIMTDYYLKGRIGIKKLVDLLCTNPCKIFKIKDRGSISVGNFADLTIYNLNKSFEIKDDWIESNCSWTPYNGKKISVSPFGTIISGKKVVWNQKLEEKSSGIPIAFG